MVITNIGLQKKDNGRFNLEVDGRFICSISATTLAIYTLYKGKEISEEKLNEISKKEIENRFFDRSLNLVSASPKTKRQVLIYLQQLAYKKKGLWFEEGLDLENVFEKILEKLEKYKYIDDKEYAKLFVESRLKNRPRGKQVLISELIGKGVDVNIAKEVVDTLVVDTHVLIIKAFKKRFRDTGFNIKNRKHVDFLLRKGFDWDDICKI
ncbi:RecX family transcriptional regulator [Candidatus Dojkabacteria bacterium]|nr:RecX family transcriptional regulator [Candidatus Dojkabacteria bacterium]